MTKTIKIILFIAFIAFLFLTYNPNTHAEAPTIDFKALEIEKQDSDPLFNKIGYCESKNIATAKNPGSTAKGRFQFLDGTWKWYAPKLWGADWINKDPYNYQDNTDLAWFVYTNYGTSDWEADPKSYNCWKSEIPNAIYKNIY